MVVNKKKDLFLSFIVFLLYLSFNSEIYLVIRAKAFCIFFIPAHPSSYFLKKPQRVKQSIKVKGGHLFLRHTPSLDTLPKNTKLPVQCHPSEWPETSNCSGTTILLTIYKTI